MKIKLVQGPLDGEELDMADAPEEIAVPIHVQKDRRSYKLFEDACKIYFYRRAVHRNTQVQVPPVATATYRKSRECQINKKGEITEIYYDYVEMKRALKPSEEGDQQK